MAALGGEDLQRLGRLAEARAAFAAEAEVAERTGDAEAFGRAALGLSGLWVHDYRTRLERAQVAALQERALAGLHPEQHLARRLRLRLEIERIYGTIATGRLVALVEDARTHGDPVLLAEALHLVYFCLLGPEHLSRRLDLAEELIAMSPLTGETTYGLLGLANRALVLHELGDGGAGRALHELQAALTVTPCAAITYAMSVIEVMRQIGTGRLADAEESAARTRELGVRVGDADAETWHAAQVLAIRWLQGRTREMLELCEAYVDSVDVAEPAGIAFLAARAVAAAESGEESAARTSLAQLRLDAADLPVSTSWLAAVFAVGEAAYALRDRVAAAAVLQMLGPFAGLPVIASRGTVSFGSTNRTLGLAAATLEQWDEAVQRLEQALADDDATGNVVCRPHTRWILAEVLQSRGTASDAARAAPLRSSALDEARHFELTGRVTAWSAATVPTGVVLTRTGRTWHVELGGRHTSVPASVGMGYLAQLVANPGVEIAATDLVSAHTVREAPSGDVVDQQAMAAYRARVRELQHELEEADVAGDGARSARAQTELDSLLGELQRATGLGGNTRSFADAHERARVSVHKAISRALRTLREADAEIGAELAGRVTTGIRCVYGPRP
ncbi:hypothetical protein [Nocardioides lacusdianchii]|uniref:hypothetical protein n=1 Tax=Nocardioides lacusdianchii TaxID=2783664 RepID=UPI001CD017A2|nr:hypothetical protein [Nocardioides lacusdianchii]